MTRDPGPAGVAGKPRGRRQRRIERHREERMESTPMLPAPSAASKTGQRQTESDRQGEAGQYRRRDEDRTET